MVGVSIEQSGGVIRYRVLVVSICICGVYPSNLNLTLDMIRRVSMRRVIAEIACRMKTNVHRNIYLTSSSSPLN